MAPCSVRSWLNRRTEMGAVMRRPGTTIQDTVIYFLIVLRYYFSDNPPAGSWWRWYRPGWRWWSCFEDSRPLTLRPLPNSFSSSSPPGAAAFSIQLSSIRYGPWKADSLAPFQGCGVCVQTGPHHSVPQQVCGDRDGLSTTGKSRSCSYTLSLLHAGSVRRACTMRGAAEPLCRAMLPLLHALL